MGRKSIYQWSNCLKVAITLRSPGVINQTATCCKSYYNYFAVLVFTELIYWLKNILRVLNNNFVEIRRKRFPQLVSDRPGIIFNNIK